jgi:hypothetical protein
MASDNPVMAAVGRLAAAQRKDRNIDPRVLADARNELVVARTERAILQAVQPEDPDYEPLRTADRKRLAKILLNA